MGKDGPEGPGDSNGGREITFRRGEGVGGCGTLEEEEGKEDKDFGPDSSVVAVSVDAKRLERGQDDENSGPPVVQGEGKVNEELISIRLGRVVFLDNVIDVRDRRADEEGKDKGPDIVVRPPEVNVDGV